MLKKLNFWLILGLVLINLVMAVLAFAPNGKIILCGDLYYPLNPQLDATLQPYAWEARQGAGKFDMGNIPSHTVAFYFWGAQTLGIPIDIAQRLALWLIFILIPLSMYYLVLVVAGKIHKKLETADYISAFVAGLFYNLNLWTLFNWAPPSIHLSLSYLAAPLVLALFIQGLSTFKLKYLFYLLIVYLFITPAATNQIYILNTLWPVVFYFLVWAILRILRHDWQILKQGLIFILLILISFILVNAWWLLPLLTNFAQATQWVESGMNISGWLSWKSTMSSFLNIFRFTNHAGWIGHDPDAPYRIIASAAEYMRLIPLILASFVFPILAFASLFWARKNRFLLFFAVLVLVFMFLAKGTHEPLGSINFFLHQNIFLLKLYRSVEWYTPMVVLGLAYLFGQTIGFIYAKISAGKNQTLPWIVFIGSVVFILVFNYPYFQNRVVHQGAKTGEAGTSCYVKIDKNYYEAANWLSKDLRNFRLFIYPETGYYYYTDWGFGGQDLDLFLTDKPTLSPLIGVGRIKDINSLLYANLNNRTVASNNNFPLSEILSLLNVGYIKLRHDGVNWTDSGFKEIETEKIKKILTDRADLQLKKSLGPSADGFDFFAPQNFLPKIYTPAAFSFIKGEIGTLPDFLSLSYAPQEQAVFLKEAQEIFKFVSPNELFIPTLGFKEIKRPQDKYFPVLATFPRILPDSLFYPYVKFKERQELQSAKTEREQFLLNLRLANKRLTEAEKLLERGKTKEIEGLILRYKEKIDLVQEALLKLENEKEEDITDEVIIFESNILWQKELLEKLKTKLAIGQIDEALQKREQIEKKITEWKKVWLERPKEGNFYRVYLPEDGEYEILVKTATWFSLDKQFFKKGRHFLNLVIPEGLKNPTVYLYKKNAPQSSTPKLTFQKINPTKYKVWVKDVKTSYFLVFNEGYDRGWKAFVKSTSVNRYFDGKIEELESRNDFLRNDTFQTWFESSVPESQHFMANGYANSWYIDRVGKYEIILEYTPQKWVYLGLGISSLTILGLAILWRKKEDVVL